MISKYKVYDELRDTVTGFTGTVTCIYFNGERFSYSLSTEVDSKQTFMMNDFIESRLEPAGEPKGRIGFHMETN